MIWTKCPMKISSSGWNGQAEVAIPDNTSGRRYYYGAQNVSTDYARLLEKLKAEFVILLDKLSEDMPARLASVFKNGLCMEYPFPDNNNKPKDPQIHIYPLVLMPWFQKKYRQDRPETDPILFVDGKLVHWSKDVCFNCKMILDRAMKQCCAVHESCLKPLVSEKELPTEEWLAAHQTDTGHVGGEYRPIKQIVHTEAFESFSIYNITLDDKKLAEGKEKRSNAAITAANSRFIKEVSCPKCLISVNCGGYRGGGNWCKGPVIAEDYDYLFNNCEPWMVHTLLLTASENLMPEVVEAWRRMKSMIYILAPECGKATLDKNWDGKYDDDPRCVRMMRNCKGNHTARIPYLYLCKLVKAKPAGRWGDLPEKQAQSKVLRTIAYGLATRRIFSTAHIASGFGSHALELMCVEVFSDTSVKLTYDNDRRVWGRRYILTNEDFYAELVRFPGMQYTDGAAFTPERDCQNRVFRSAVNDKRLNVMMEEVKEAVRKFRYDRDNYSEEQMYEWLEERSKERCKKRRSSKQQASLPTGDPVTAT